jgi:nitrate reductase (cytochrome), electron transfer subunit
MVPDMAPGPESRETSQYPHWQCCLACHRHTNTAGTQATMVSVTHYMDRDGNFLATISPRRYFCNQCHVAQHDAKPLVGNTFVDIKSLLEQPESSSH